MSPRTLAGFALLLCAALVRADQPGEPRLLATVAGGIASVHISPDGKLVATGGGGKHVHVWDAVTGKEALALKGPSSFTCVVRFSPCGRYLAAAGYEAGAGNAIYLHDLRTGKELPRLPGHPSGGVRRLLFTPDGKQAVSAGFDGYVRVWDISSARELRSFKAESGTVYGLAMSSDGRTVVTAGRDGLRLWDLASGNEMPREAMNKHNCVACALSPDGKIVASGDSGSVTLWESATGKEVQVLRGYKGELSYLVFSADGRTLYTGSYDRMVRAWDVRSGRLLFEREGHTGWVWGVALSTDERHLASCGVDGRLMLWDLDGFARPSLKATRLDDSARKEMLDRLGSTDAGEAYKAVCALASDPGALPLLEKRLATPRGKGPTAGEIAELIKGLDSDDWPTRERSSKELAGAGARALPLLKRLLDAPPSPEARKRAERLVAAIDPTEMPAEDLEALRGVQALEYLGTSEAESLLERLSRKKSVGPRLVEEASLALKRLRSPGGR
jgi:WD40 repeat protein